MSHFNARDFIIVWGIKVIFWPGLSLTFQVARYMYIQLGGGEFYSKEVFWFYLPFVFHESSHDSRS